MTSFLRIFSDFPFGIMVAEFFMARTFDRRKFFWLRALGTAVPIWVAYTIVAESAGAYVPTSALISKLALCFVMVLTGLWLWICWKCTLNELLFCVISAFAIQNIQHNLRVNLEILIAALAGIRFTPWMSALLSIILMAIIYGTAYKLMGEWIQEANSSHVDRKRIIINSLFFVLMTIFFIPDLPEDFSVNRLMNFLYYLIADSLMLFLVVGQLKEGKQSSELEIMEHLLYAEQRQQVISQETIDVINMKCHDLKHQIALLRKGGSEEGNDEYIREIENAIQIYDSSVKTGNDTLDSILMEKLLLCEKHNIQFACIADGEKISFMKASDIYSLFGNAIDNAIESVCREDDVEKRVISLNVGSKDKILKIHMENYLGSGLELRDGLPVTTKEDKKYHGFGMMSIRHIVNKYGGEISINTDNSVFTLNIVIPLE